MVEMEMGILEDIWAVILSDSQERRERNSKDGITNWTSKSPITQEDVLMHCQS
jgi:hypothetical protein